MVGEWWWLMLFVTSNVRLVMGQLLYIWGQIWCRFGVMWISAMFSGKPKIGGNNYNYEGWTGRKFIITGIGWNMGSSLKWYRMKCPEANWLAIVSIMLFETWLDVHLYSYKQEMDLVLICLAMSKQESCWMKLQMHADKISIL